ncbi:MAG: hypothetical protein QXZ70_07835 [Candidatus Bathyarchaeia archaeon]
MIPFISGVISSILADMTLDRIKSNSKETVKIAEEKAEKIRINMHISKKTAEELLPYIIGEISKDSTKKIQKLEDLLDDRLHRIYTSIINDKDLNELLIHIQNAHPNFTSHGPDHSVSIITNLEKLIPRDSWSKLSPLEILLLLSSAWLHDIGMADYNGELYKAVTEEERKRVSQSYREQHAIRSEKYITNPINYKRLQLDRPLAEIIGTICKAHVNEYDLKNISSKWGPISGYETYGEVRVRFLAALLRLADACDLGSKRVKEVLITVYNIPHKYVESIPHLEGALLITGLIIRGKYIVVQAAPHNKEQATWVKFLVDMLKEDFLSVKPILEDKKSNGIAIPYKDVQLELLEKVQ